MAKSRPRQNQLERSDIDVKTDMPHIINQITSISKIIFDVIITKHIQTLIDFFIIKLSATIFHDVKQISLQFI